MNISDAFVILSAIFMVGACFNTKTREDERDHLMYAIATALLAIATAL